MGKWKRKSKVQPMILTALVAAGMAITASFADRRRNKRANLDQVGFMPWPLIVVMSSLTFAVSAAFALKGY
jgi:hypothetical protein